MKRLLLCLLALPLFAEEPAPLGPPAAPLPPEPVTVVQAEVTQGRGVRDFQGDDLGTAFRVLARQARINLFVSEEVKGTITLRLEDRTPLEAIETICDAKGLVLEQNPETGVYSIKPAAELIEEEATAPVADRIRRSAEQVAAQKGAYLDALRKQGIPESTAMALVERDALTPALLLDQQREAARASADRDVAEFRVRIPASNFDWVSWLISSAWALLWLLPLIVFHLAVASVVYIRARRLSRAGTKLAYFSPLLWGMVVLATGITGLIAFWLTNESGLPGPEPPPSCLKSK